jgi:hypothetical protein
MKNTTNSDTRYAFAGSQKSESAPGAEENSPPIHQWVERVGINAHPHPSPLLHPPTLRYGAVQIDSRFEAKRRRKEGENCPPVAGSGFGLRASFGFRHSDFGFPFMSLLEVKNLKVHFPVKPGMFSRVREFVKAVDGVRVGRPREFSNAFCAFCAFLRQMKFGLSGRFPLCVLGGFAPWR